METWRLIDSGTCAAAFNMALDESIATVVRKEGSPPTLRLYGWDRPSLSIGSFQKVSDINIDYCKERGIPIVRRPTGGRAILHEKELTYSFSVRTVGGPFSHGLLDSYRRIGVVFNLAFGKIGVLHADTKKRRERGEVLNGSPLCFQSSSFGEILIENKKAMGSAQKRWDDGLLQQGSIPYEVNEEELCAVFGLKTTAVLRESMTVLKEAVPGLNEDIFKNMVAASFAETFGVSLEPSLPSPEELSLAWELEERKYLQSCWNLHREVR
jgi:lipoyl(octanoyl) transferase